MRIIVAAATFARWLLPARTPRGRAVPVVAGTEEPADPRGLRMRCSKAFVHVLIGSRAGLAAVFPVSGFGVGHLLEGMEKEPTTIASAVMGGTLRTSELGAIPTAVAGALLLGSVLNPVDIENGPGRISLSV